MNLLRAWLVLLVLPLVLSLGACEQAPKYHYAALSSDATILAFGDSLTYGTGANSGQSYPEVLSALSGLKIINAGVPGELSGDGMARLPALIKQHQPELMILIHGGNDLLKKRPEAELIQNLSQMIALAKNAEVAVVMMNVPKPALFLEPNALYQEIAQTYQVAIDESSLSDILGKSKYKSDYVHPNAKGYALMADALFKLLKGIKAL